MTATLPIAPNMAQALALGDLLQYADAGIVSRTLYTSDTLRVVLFAFAPGQELTEHTNGRRALVQVIAGRCQFKFNDRWEWLEQGALLHLPPRHPHALKATDGRCALLLTLHGEPESAETGSSTESNT